MTTFRIALSGDFKKADGSPAFPDFDLTPLAGNPAVEYQYLQTNGVIGAADLEGFDALILLQLRIDQASFPKDGRLAIVARSILSKRACARCRLYSRSRKMNARMMSGSVTGTVEPYVYTLPVETLSRCCMSPPTRVSTTSRLGSPYLAMTARRWSLAMVPDLEPLLVANRSALAPTEVLPVAVSWYLYRLPHGFWKKHPGDIHPSQGPAQNQHNQYQRHEPVSFPCSTGGAQNIRGDINLALLPAIFFFFELFQCLENRTHVPSSREVDASSLASKKPAAR